MGEKKLKMKEAYMIQTNENITVIVWLIQFIMMILRLHHWKRVQKY